MPEVPLARVFLARVFLARVLLARVLLARVLDVAGTVVPKRWPTDEIDTTVTKTAGTQIAGTHTAGTQQDAPVPEKHQQPEASQACDRILARLEDAAELQRNNRSAYDDRVGEPVVAYALSLVRMRVRPSLEPGWWDCDPIHVSVLGTTNSGKSTILNLLLGRAAAGMNARARYTQHPQAYRPPEIGDGFLDDYPSRLAHCQRYENTAPPSQTHEQLIKVGYSRAYAVFDLSRPDVAALPAEVFLEPVRPHPDVGPGVVFWDAPDYSTEEAQYWMSAVLDVVAVADLVLSLVTDQSYADDRGLQLWRMISQSGLRLHVVANKVGRQPELLEDIHSKLHEAWAGQPREDASVDLTWLPRVDSPSPVELLENLAPRPEVRSLRRKVEFEISRREQLKAEALSGTISFLNLRWQEIIEPLAREAKLAQQWRELVQERTQKDLLERFGQEYLETQHHPEFALAVEQAIERLEVPGVGVVIKTLQWPFKKTAEYITTRFWSQGSEDQLPPELEKLHELIGRWLAELRGQAQSLADRDKHPYWRQLSEQLRQWEDSGQLTRQLDQPYQQYRREVDQEIERRAEALHSWFQEHPGWLRVAQGGKLVADLAVVLLAVSQGGLTGLDLIVGPVMAPAVRTLLEMGLQALVVQQRALLRDFQLQAVTQLIQDHLVTTAMQAITCQVQDEDLVQLQADFQLVCQRVQDNLSRWQATGSQDP